MLAAHLVPGYFASVKSRSTWKPKWSNKQRALLWATALGSTIVPDMDVVYNALFRGFFNHSTLWTHSLFVYLVIELAWLVLSTLKRWPYLKTLAGLIAFGGFSHLTLDAITHGTPLLYPISMKVFGIAPDRVIEGGIWAYLTDPIFLLEPILFSIAIVHWVLHWNIVPWFQRLILATAIGGLILFTVTFVLLLPELQGAVVPLAGF